MENLAISEMPPQGGPMGGPGGLPQPPPQLPPQMFTTAAQLLDLTDSMETQPFYPSLVPRRRFVSGEGNKLFRSKTLGPG